jgi:hypothetical protein
VTSTLALDGGHAGPMGRGEDDSGGSGRTSPRRVVEPFGRDEEHVDPVALDRSSDSSQSSRFSLLIVRATTRARSAIRIWLRISRRSGETRIVGSAPESRSRRVAMKYSADLPAGVPDKEDPAALGHDGVDRLSLGGAEGSVRPGDDLQELAGGARWRSTPYLAALTEHSTRT